MAVAAATARRDAGARHRLRLAVLLPGEPGDQALQQVANVATLPGIVEASYAMPDVHWGYGFPIGGVAATEVGSRRGGLSRRRGLRHLVRGAAAGHRRSPETETRRAHAEA